MLAQDHSRRTAEAICVVRCNAGYIGGYSGVSEGSKSPALARAVAFGFGVASTLTVLGLVSTSVGSAYGQMGASGWLPLGVNPLVTEDGSLLLVQVKPSSCTMAFVITQTSVIAPCWVCDVILHSHMHSRQNTRRAYHNGRSLAMQESAPLPCSWASTC